MRRLILLSVVSGFLLALSAMAYGQQFDAAFGINGLKAPSASNAGPDYSPQTIGGGVYPKFSADFLFWHNAGINGEVSWRVGQNLYQGFQPFRPVFFDFNGIWAPSLGKRAAVDLMAGIGAESVRFYQPTYNCGFTGCTNYTSDNHFMGHFGGGIRLYVTSNVFVRPSVDLFMVHNNFEFSGARATQFGLSVGYSFRPGF